MQGSPILSDEEKRGLILAHAQMRKERRRPSLQAWHYMAIGVACLIVFVGWWSTIDRNITQGAQLPRKGSLSDILRTHTQGIGAEFETVKEQSMTGADLLKQHFAELTQTTSTTSTGASAILPSSTTTTTSTKE